MKVNFYKRFKSILILMLIVQSSSILNAQNLKISDFVLFGKDATYIGPGCSLHRNPPANIKGGSVGSNTLIQTNTNTTITGNIYSGGTVQLDNNNTIDGNITAANWQAKKNTILLIGKQANISGNIDVNGNIVIGSGLVSGQVTHPAPTTYSGPTPKGGNITGTPTLPVLPAMPDITNFPAAEQQI